MLTTLRDPGHWYFESDPYDTFFPGSTCHLNSYYCSTILVPPSSHCNWFEDQTPSAAAWFSNELQKLGCMTGYQENNLINGFWVTCPIKYWQDFLHFNIRCIRQCSLIISFNFIELFPCNFVALRLEWNLNSLWPSDAIWRQRSGSTLAQVMACCLTAASHYLNQMLTDHQWSPVTFILGQFHKRCLNRQLLKHVWKLHV